MMQHDKSEQKNYSDEYITFDTSAEALSFIYKKYGAEIFLGQKLSAYLADYSPDISTNKRLLIKSLYKRGISDLFRKALNGSDDDKLEVVKKSKTRLREAYIDENAANTIIGEFISALGWEINGWSKSVETNKSDSLEDNSISRQPKDTQNDVCFKTIPPKKNVKTPVKEHIAPDDPYIDYVNEGLKCLYPEEKDVKANYYEAKDLFSKAAENGSTWCQYYMGVIYANAYGVRDCDRNHEKAIDWYYQSAESGNLAAVCALGDAYYEGVLTYQDIPLAMEYYKKAADINDSHGQYGIGICLLEGDRVEQKNGVKWIRLAAEQGYSLAEYRLGICLREGKGTPKNESEAIKWIYLAAEQGEPNAQYELALCYLNGNGIKSDNSKALKYFTLSADQGNIDAMYYAGVMYINGMGTKINEQKAFKLFSDASDTGHINAQCELGKLYYFGKGANQDQLRAEVIFRTLAIDGHYESMFYCGECFHKRNQFSCAIDEYKRAADEGGFAPAQRMVGIYYEKGRVLDYNPEKAFSYYLKSAQGGDMEGVAHLGVCYCNGIGTSVDYSKAIPLLEKGVNAGIGLAEYQLGDCYEHGYGVTENKEKAIELYQLASSHNNQYAKNRLAEINFINTLEKIGSGIKGKIFKGK